MIAAESAVQRSPDAKLLVVDSQRNISHVPRAAFVEFLRPNDLVIANDAATLPASLSGLHEETGKPIEVRLAGRPSLNPFDVGRFSAVVFGEGDFHMRTEDRPLPPALSTGDRLEFGYISCHYLAEDYPQVLDILRNEKPVYVEFEVRPGNIQHKNKRGTSRRGRTGLSAGVSMAEIASRAPGKPYAATASITL